MSDTYCIPFKLESNGNRMNRTVSDSLFRYQITNNFLKSIHRRLKLFKEYHRSNRKRLLGKRISTEETLQDLKERACDS